ncbi:MAG: hypothetical protein ACI8YQ_003629 [Polaribacter sp.]|jgi:hypothetical protein
MKKSIKIIATCLLSLVLIMSIPADVVAQCPMCKIAAESNLENGGTAGKGLNEGILWMFSMPYVMVGLIGFLWYRNKRDDEDVDFDKF